MERNTSPTIGVIASPDVGTRWLLFRCAGRGLAVELRTVREITTPMRPTRIPGCGPEVYGLVGQRGRVITVFDFGAALAQRASSESEHHRILLIEQPGRVVGAAVDDVISVTDLEAEAGPLEGLHQLPGLRPDEVVGTCVAGEERFIALDIDRILARMLA